jgi:hypothetical protein
MNDFINEYKLSNHHEYKLSNHQNYQTLIPWVQSVVLIQYELSREVYLGAK